MKDQPLNIFYLFGLYSNERETTAQSLHVLFQDTSPEKIFYFLLFLQYFWKNLTLKSFLC